MAPRTPLFHRRGGKHGSESADRVIAAIAKRHHGVVSRAQLIAAGVTSREIERRLKSGHLIRLHRGVYAVGHTKLTVRGRWMAAVLAAGPRAVLSYRDAAALHGIRPSNRYRIDVTVPKWRPAPDGVDLHTSRIEDDERTVIDGIPVTTAFRTLLDLATTLNDRELQQALNEAERLQIAETPSLTRLCKRHENRPGSKRLRKLQPEPRITRSQLERNFLAYLREHDLPLPQTNIVVEGYTVDCVWREHGLVAELDGYEFHDTRRAFDDDRERDQDLQAAGWRTVRITEPHLRTPRLARRLRALTR